MNIRTIYQYLAIVIGSDISRLQHVKPHSDTMNKIEETVKILKNIFPCASWEICLRHDNNNSNTNNAI